MSILPMPLPSPRPPVSERLTATLADARVNNRANDYSYHSGWNPEHVLGQQTRFGVNETEALIAALPNRFPDRAELKEAIQQLLTLTTTDKNVGTVAFTDVVAADLMTQFARQNGVSVTFGASMTPPTHPVG